MTHKPTHPAKDTPEKKAPQKPAAGTPPEEGASCLTPAAVEDMLDEELEQSLDRKSVV